MKNFIEVTTTDNERRLININTISFIKDNNGSASIYILATARDGISRHISVKESYDTIKTMIQDSL